MPLEVLKSRYNQGTVQFKHELYERHRIYQSKYYIYNLTKHPKLTSFFIIITTISIRGHGG